MRQATIFLKGNAGSGWFSPPDGTHLPSSAHIETVEQARDYWREHFDGKVMSLTVHTGGREIPVKVRFDADCPDAYTDSRDESGSKLEMRRFSVKRSRAMDRILSTIAHPYRRLRNWNADLLLEARKRGEHFTVVLTWREAARLYEFHSSHFKTVAEVQRLHQKQDARKNNGPLQKSEPYCAGPSVFKANYEAGVSPTGSQLRNVAPARNCAVNLPSFHEIVKAAPKLTKAHTVFLLCNDDPWSQKLLLKGLGSGERWITVHPSGKSEKGTPVLVRETKQGSGVFHVIGGAGGKLNYLKLRGLKSEKEYRQAVKERQSTKRDQSKEKREADRRDGTYAGKKSAKESIKTQAALQEQRFIQTVANAMGWDDTEFPEDNYKDVSDAAYKKALRQHHSKQLKRARDAADLQRKRLLADADARAAALGEIPFGSDDADVLALDDFAPEPGNGGLGYATKYKERGGPEEEIQAESKEISEKEKAPEAIERQERRKADADAIAGELKEIKQPRTGRAKLVEAKAAVDILKAEKALKLVSQKAKEANKKIDEGEIQAFPLEVSETDLGDLVKKDIENELGTLTTRAFLDEVGKVGNNPEKALGRHIGVGAYNSLNSVALVAGGEGLIDRDVVDVLGIAGSSQILARRLKTDLTETEYEDIKNALGDFHKDRYMEMSEDAMREAREWHDLAKSIEIDAASNGHDLAAMQELNAKRRDAISAANRILGESLGEMEANAAMVVALEQGARDQIEVSMGNLAVADAIRRARAIGLDRGDYQIHSVGSNRFLTVTGAGMDKLAMPVDRDLLASTRKAIDIIEGRHDEDNWLPMGVANRPDLAMKTPAGVAPGMAELFAPGADLEQSIRDYIGGRTADGDTPDAIYESLNSSGFVEKAGDPEAYFAALDKVVSTKDKNGKRVRVESHKDAFEGMADQFVESRYGASRSPLHQQRFEVDQHAVDALHRALSAEPAGTLAYKPVGELHRKEQGHLRRYFYQNIGNQDEKSQALRDDLAEIEGREPEKEVSDMFGTGTNPAWVDWKQRRNAKAEELGRAGLDWPKYVEMMGSPEKAYSTVQDIIKSNVHKAFADAHNTLNPDRPLKVGRAQVRNNLSHLDAVDPAARERRQEEHRHRIDRLRNRIEGRYSGGAVADKIEAARQAEEAMNQAQMGLFSADEMGDAARDIPLAADERHSLGQAAENQIASMIGMVGKNFKPNEPTRLWQASMSGRYIGQQRAVRLATENKRLILNQGVGSGKSLISLASFAHLHSQGKVRRGIFAVPSIVLGQFSGEALRYLEPGKLKWHIEPGASRDERIAAYKDPETHFSVVTHQALRDDLIHLGAKHAGVDEKVMAERLDGMTPEGRKAWAQEVMSREGINYDFLNVDEGHDLLNRAGKKNSSMANVLDAVSHNTPYYINASADAIAKNDPSEIFSALQKMDPDRYRDRDRFMRRYGVDTPSSREALRRELARYFYPGRIDPGVTAKHTETTVPLSDSQKTRLIALDKAVAAARIARMGGKVDVDAMKALIPSAFAHAPAERHEKIAAKLQDNAAILHQTAVRKALNEHPDGGKLAAIDKVVKEKAGKPGVIFAHSREAVKQIADRLRSQGHRVVTLTGSDSAKEKARKKLMFRPESGEPEADIFIASDAGAVGANLQRGQWLVQYDTPMTAKTWHQRNGRIHRLGQENNVELIDLVHDHRVERQDRKRLKDKSILRGVFTDPIEGLDDSGLGSYLSKARMDREERP